MNAIEMIQAERQRQIHEEGFTPRHDADLESGELAAAAACYATPSHMRTFAHGLVPLHWPFPAHEWKPSASNRILELVKAAALIVAEIERLQSLPVSKSNCPHCGKLRTHGFTASEACNACVREILK